MNKLLLTLVLVVFSFSPCFAEQQEHSEPVKVTQIDNSDQKKASVSGHFSTTKWIDELTAKGAIDRHESFRQFLQDFNLIGMPRERVVELLGPEQFLDSNGRSVYTLLSAPIDIGNNLCINYENNRVTQWQFEHLGKTGPWIQSNVLWAGSNGIPAGDGTTRYYIPKM